MIALVMQSRVCKQCRRLFIGADEKYCTGCGRPLARARVSAKLLKKIREPDRRPTYDHIILDDPCSYCFEMAWPMTIDHIEPQAHGGSKKSWTNRTGACYECNQAKSDTKLLLHMLERCATVPVVV